jgi:isocitrate/isopropylmalate dehydrogenase
MMLDYLDYKEAGVAIESAVQIAINDGETTSDLGGSLSTKEAGAAICDRIS